MPNQFASLPVPSEDGIGASVDTSGFGANKTISVGGDLAGATLTVECGNGAVDGFAPLKGSQGLSSSFDRPGNFSINNVTTAFMRVIVAGARGVVNATVDVAANEPGFQGPPGAGATLLHGASRIGSGADTRFLLPGKGEGMAPLASEAAYRLPRAGVLRNLRVRHNDSGGNGNPVVYTILINGIPTDLTTSLDSGVIGDAANVVNIVNVLAGDLFEVTAAKASSIGAGGGVCVMVIVELA